MTAIERAWQKPLSWSLLLLPLSWLFGLIGGLRRKAFQRGWLKSYRSELPVIVVGNINVGGSGKTPTVIWLCERLLEKGWKPAVVSRGYGGNAPYYPFNVTSASETAEVGDEPLLIHLRTGCPVVVSPERAEAVKWLEQYSDVDVIITDDGLQHYKLQRDLELVVIDGARRFGNQQLLPAGPLREPVSRLHQVDFLVCNGGKAAANEHLMQLRPATWRQVNSNEPMQLCLDKLNCLAIAGIGHPQRFFDTLSKYAGSGEFDTQPLADHQPLQQQQLRDWSAQYDRVLMTEKDAVKCASWAPDNCYYLPVSAELDNSLLTEIDLKLRKKQQELNHAIR